MTDQERADRVQHLLFCISLADREAHATSHERPGELVPRPFHHTVIGQWVTELEAHAATGQFAPDHPIHFNVSKAKMLYQTSRRHYGGALG